jgi:DNA-binding LacI/PurR family transcriptional regulator
MDQARTPVEHAGTARKQRPAAADPGGRPAPNIRDVAADAGVSYQTVSRVLNDSSAVRADTRQRVLDSIQALGFRPNRAARSLVAGRQRAVTVVTAETTLYGHASTLRGIEEAARAAGYTVSVAVIDSTDEAHVRLIVDMVADPTSGGVIVIGFDPATVAVLDAMPESVPAVAVTEPQRGRRRQPSIALDERAAAAEATTYLLGLGHRTVHHVAIPSARRTTGRQAGWLAALKAAGITPPPVVAAGWQIADGYAAGRRLAADPTVTAILCGNDDLALGVRRAMHDLDRQVPADVSIIGFDDVPGAAYWTPSLTTVRMDFVALGRASLALVDALLTGAAAAVQQLPAPTLIVRESTGPCTGARGQAADAVTA